MVLTSQFIPVPGVWTNPDFCAGQAKCRELWVPGMVREQGNGSASLPCADTELGSPAKISLWSQCTDPHPLKLVELDGGSSSSSGTRNKRLEQKDPRWKGLVQFVGDLNHSAPSQLLCLARTGSVTVKGEEGHSGGRLRRSEAQTDTFKGWAEWQMPVR